MSDQETEQDPVELEYERAIRQAEGRGENDRAHELSVGLAEYRELYR